MARRVALVVGNYVNVVDGVALTYGRVVRERLLAGDQLMILGPGPAPGARPRVEPAGAFVPLPSTSIPVQPEYRLALGIPNDVRAQLERFEPELIHVASPDLAGVAALDFAQTHGLPAVAAYHSEIAGYLRYLPGSSRLASLGSALERPLWAWIRRFYNRCRAVYVPTAATREDLRRRGVTPPMALWGRGVDLDRFAPRWRDRAWRRTIGADEDTPIVCFAARLRWEKGLDVLAAVLRALDGRDLSHRALIVGDGPGRAELARKLPHARFVGELDVGALARALASADVFLYPSPTETFGNVTLEAMASGLPCVGADVLGSRSLVDDGETGILVAPGDVAGFADATAALLTDPARRRRLGAAARERASGRAWRAACDRLAELWDQAIQ